MAKSIRGEERLLLKIYKNWDENVTDIGRESFMVQDVLGLLMRMNRKDTTLVLIQNYYGTKEEKENAIKELLSLFDGKEDVAILTWAYVSTDEFKEDEYYDTESYNKEYIKKSIEEGKKPIPWDEVIERESKLLESLGFYDINHFVQYEYSKAYLYGNKLGKEVINYINEMEK